MKPIHRSLAGLALAIVALPAFLSLMACLPVPIGDPEKSRIDPELTGAWYSMGDGGGIVTLAPWDKRTWLMTLVEVSLVDDEDCPAGDEADSLLDTLEGFLAALEVEDSWCVQAEKGAGLYKVWVTQLRGETFMVWEAMSGYEYMTGAYKRFWMTFRLERSAPDSLELHWMDLEYFEDVEGFEELLELAINEEEIDQSEARRVKKRVDRVIRRNADDPSLVDEDEIWVWQRIELEKMGLVADVISDVIEEPFE